MLNLEFVKTSFELRMHLHRIHASLPKDLQSRRKDRMTKERTYRLETTFQRHERERTQQRVAEDEYADP